MTSIEHLKSLEVDNRRNWFLNQNTSLLVPILIIGWGLSLIFALMYGNLTNSIFLYPVCFFIAGLIIYGLGTIYKIKNTPNLISREFDSKEKAKELSVYTITIAPLLIGFSSLLMSVFFIGGFFMGTLGFLIFLAFAYMIYSNLKKIAHFNQISKRFGKSKIIHDPINLTIGDYFTVQFLNDILAKEKMEISVTLLNLSEKMYSKKSKKSTSEPITYIRHEEKQVFIYDTSKKVIKFFLSPTGTLPTKLGYEPDYWELQFKQEELEFFARFILDVRKGN